MTVRENTDVTAERAVSPRWTLHAATEADDEELRDLFTVIFGHAMLAAQWQWKYHDAPLRGTVLRRSGKAVAFFGGMPRCFMHQGCSYTGVQNGDVMVLPSERGVFSRQGALYHAASHFFSHHVGAAGPYAFAFGFPSERHFQLGIKLGLYAPAGRMMELGWAPLPTQHHSWRWQWGVLNPKRLADIDRLWQQMQRDWTTLYTPVRDAQRWQHRYLQHPAQPYSLLMLRRRWTGGALAALVLREHPSHCEWLDYVGPKVQMARAVQAAREWAGTKGKRLTALVSDAVVEAFALQVEAVNVSQIGIPVNAIQGQDAPMPWVGKFWFMGGDSDFL